jgi:Tol biopolymer transport system component
MGKLALLRRTFRAFRAAAGGNRRRPAVEQLEDRTLLSILGPLAGFTPTPIRSDGAGGASQALTSYDGRFVVYSSTATNAVAGQVNEAVGSNVFLYDRLHKTTTLVSHVPGSAATAADGSSDAPRISSDGRYVAYESTAPDLVPGQAGPRGQENVFLYDTAMGTNTLVSGTYDPSTGSASLTVTANDASATVDTTGFGFGPDSGRFLLFESFASDLAANQDGPVTENLFLYDTQLQTTTLVSHTPGSTAGDRIGGDDDTQTADLTPDGSFVVFESLADHLVPGQSDEFKDNIYLYDNRPLLPGTSTPNPNFDHLTLVSGATSAPATEGAGFSLEPQISADGGLISYVSSADDLVSGQTPPGSSFDNIFLYDNRPVLPGGSGANPHYGHNALVSGAYDAAHMTTSPSQTGNGDSPEAVLSSDGSTVAFLSAATNLTGDDYPAPDPGDTDGNVFLFDATTLYTSRSLTLASFVTDASGPTTTAAGGVDATPNDSFLDLSLSGDGRFLSYESAADDLVPGQAPTNSQKFVTNVFLYDSVQNQTTLVSRAHGAPADTANNDSFSSHVSGDGSTVAFLSAATNVGATDTGGTLTLADQGQDVFAYAVASAADGKLVSRSAFPATTSSLVWGTSADGRYVVFTSNDPHVIPGQQDQNFDQDVFLLDRSTGQITLVSHVPGSATQTGDIGAPDTEGGGLGAGPVISADGKWVAFISDDSNLVANENPGGGANQIFLFDNRPGPTHGTVSLVSHDSASPKTAGDDDSGMPTITDDQTGNTVYVAYQSFAEDLVPFFANPDDGESVGNVYLYQYDAAAGTGTNRLLSQDVGNPATPDATHPRFGGDSTSSAPTISDGGRYVAYVSRASNLVTQTTNSVNNVYLFDNTTGRTLLVTRDNASASLGADDSSFAPVLSADGSTLAFTSFATDLSPGQATPPGTDFTNVFLYSVAGHSIRLVSGRHGSATLTGDGYSDSPALSTDGSRVAFRSDAPDLLPGVTFPTSGSNVFLFGVPAAPVTLVSHDVNPPLAPAAGTSEAPGIDGAGDLVVYLSRATDLVPGQQEPGVAVNNVFVYSAALMANGLASGQGGSITTPSPTPAFQALISRDPVVVFNLLAQANTSVAQLNSLAELVLSPNTITDGSPPGTVVGTLSVSSIFAGQYLRPQYQPLPAGSPFALGGTMGNAVPLVTAFAANAAAQSSYQVLPVVNIGFGFTPAALTVFVGPHAPPPPPDPLLAELVTVRVGKHKKARLMVEVIDLVTGAEVEALVCPFQAPTYRAITLTPVGPGLFRLSARKGKHTVTTLLTI